MDTDKQKTKAVKDKVKGKTNEVAGAVQGDTSQEIKGKAQQALGEGRQRIAKAVDDEDEGD